MSINEWNNDRGQYNLHVSLCVYITIKNNKVCPTKLSYSRTHVDRTTAPPVYGCMQAWLWHSLLCLHTRALPSALLSVIWPSSVNKTRLHWRLRNLRCAFAHRRRACLWHRVNTPAFLGRRHFTLLKWEELQKVKFLYFLTFSRKVCLAVSLADKKRLRRWLTLTLLSCLLVVTLGRPYLVSHWRCQIYCSDLVDRLLCWRCNSVNVRCVFWRRQLQAFQWNGLVSQILTKTWHDNENHCSNQTCFSVIPIQTLRRYMYLIVQVSRTYLAHVDMYFLRVVVTQW